jgi:8-oxo-dGTP diphosphatase
MAEYGTRVGILRSWRYCPRCAAELDQRASRVQCPACGFCVRRRRQRGLLLARRAHEPDAGLWDTPGGFLDEGEEPRAALLRELREEAGVEIEIGDFFGMFLDRYGAGDEAPWVLNLAWETAIVAGEPAPADDVAELRWFAPAALPPDDELAFGWLAGALREWRQSRSRP